MQAFGLIGLLITIALAALWITSNEPVSNTVDENVEISSAYAEAIDSAREAVDTMESKNSPSGKSVTVYDGISVPDNTTKLNLSNRNLSGSLKAEIRQLSSLKELDISNNNFTGLPAEVGQLSSLEVLDLSFNPFTGLPQELGNLSNLKTLDLRGTKYSNFDLEIIKSNLPSSTNILTD